MLRVIDGRRNTPTTYNEIPQTPEVGYDSGTGHWKSSPLHRIPGLRDHDSVFTQDHPGKYNGYGARYKDGEDNALDEEEE